MSQLERLTHSLIFELFAIIILTLFLVDILDQETGPASMLAITLSVIAMVWNYLFNLWFDLSFGFERIKRKLSTRCFHALGFELGLMIITLPLLMWVLSLDFLTILILDFGVIVFFIVYSLIFNLMYDHARQYLKKYN